MNPHSNQEEVAVYREKIIDEICYALGVGRSGVMRRLLGPLFRRPADRFGQVAARADNEVKSTGISGGARKILPDFSLAVSARGIDLIPADGPLLLAANHPGGLDSLAILSCLPRKDVKVLLSDVPFTRAFLEARQFFIYVPPERGGRMAALRASIDHLRNGGALLIFAHGDVEPDPETRTGAALSIQDWSRSIEIILRRVPESWFQVAIVSGVLDPKVIRSPIVRIRKSPARRQKLAEVLQLSRQMLSPRGVSTHAHISFAGPVMATDLTKGEMMPVLIGIARRLLENHLASWRIPFLPSGPLP